MQKKSFKNGKDGGESGKEYGHARIPRLRIGQRTTIEQNRFIGTATRKDLNTTTVMNHISRENKRSTEKRTGVRMYSIGAIEGGM